MSQHDYDIANAAGATVRADINNVLDAIATNNSGATAPSTTFANQWWFDTGNNLMKQRNAGNTAWITMAAKDGSGWRPYYNGTVVGSIVTANLLDDDSFSADSATDAASQQSIKAYVDSNSSAGPTVATPVSTVSVASVDISIGAGANQVDIVLDNVSTNGFDFGAQIGDSGGIETSGYQGIVEYDAGRRTSTTSVPFTGVANDLARRFGVVSMRRVGTSNTWIFSGNIGDTTNLDHSTTVTGSKTLSGELTTVRLLVSSGQFDNGQFTVHYQ